MRIRKNAKLFPSHQNPSLEDHRLQPLVCQLNQSPWDVISLSPTKNSFYCPLFLPRRSKFERESTPTGARSSWNCAAPSSESNDNKPAIVDDAERGESYAKVKKAKKKKTKQGISGLSSTKRSSQNIDNGWHGKEETAVNGDSDSVHRIFKCPSRNGVAAKVPSRRARWGKKHGSSNPYEFYYYSGFGPSWGKRRGVDGGQDDGQYRNLHLGGGNKRTVMSPTAHTMSSWDVTTSHHHELGQTRNLGGEEDFNLGVLDEEERDREESDEDDVGDGGGSRRRIRKPVKARSLKSLM